MTTTCPLEGDTWDFGDRCCVPAHCRVPLWGVAYVHALWNAPKLATLAAFARPGEARCVSQTDRAS